MISTLTQALNKKKTYEKHQTLVYCLHEITLSRAENIRDSMDGKER